jgi:hypothetical protein
MPARDTKLDDYIRANPTMPVKEIAHHTGKSLQVIRRKRKDLGFAPFPMGNRKLPLNFTPCKRDIVKYYGPVVIDVPLRDKIIQPEWLCIDKPPNLRRRCLYE